LFSDAERVHFPPSASTCVIPHFIRSRPRIDRQEARRFLNLRSDVRIGGVLGFIHPRKGPDRALALLAPNGALDEVVFAGQFLSKAYEDQLRDEVRRLNLEGRVHFTGYLSDESFAYWANACDVGLCPFVEVSASGSLSDWFALRKPVVAHHLPQLDFYKARSGDGLLLTDTTSPEQFRSAVNQAQQLSDESLTPLDRMVEELAAPEVARRYAQLALQLALRPPASLSSQLRSLLVGQGVPIGKRSPDEADGHPLR
jgi:glycosyltransferase involved in cell wall biosynthesis